MTTVIIDKKYCGPTESGNGGYTSGLFAKHLDFDAEITLRVPPPLGTPLAIQKDGDSATLMAGETLVATARLADFDLEIPEPPDFTSATAATKNYMGLEGAPFPLCYVCGADRQKGDGLQIYAGPVGEQQVASPWVPAIDLAGEGDTVATEYIWAALDCPGAWAVMDYSEVIVLGRFAVKIVRPLKVQQPYISMGWGIDRDGRKIKVGTALFDSDKKVMAYGQATWIQLKR